MRALALLAILQCCDIRAIKVPVVWNSDSEVTSDEEHKTSADKITHQRIQQPIPIDYFQYTAKKPQFAVDIAAFHGVKSPENHYKAYPIDPYTGQEKPVLGKHRIQEADRPVFQHFQQYVNKDEDVSTHVTPTSANYEVFHPYKAEEPGLQELYKDPILDKIRNDIRDSSQRLQTYEKEAGKPNIESDEYLESVEQTDRKKVPHRNRPAPYEIHRPQRRPIYYRPIPRNPHRDHVLNQRFRHPWNQNFVKVRPLHYEPLQNHLHRLRQHHALKFDDERNEYPQVPAQEHYEEPSDGYDIYEKGKAKFVQLRNNLDESINDAVRENRPSAPQRLELQSDDQSGPDEEEEFVPIKNYAQVRKTETTKHLPKSAAFKEADNLEEIKNAPRLREAIKSTKAQTVYTEEGYEDSAYDHAGEQKHASDHEGHAGYLKEKELSSGKFKTPSISLSYEDGKGSAYKDQVIDGKKWEDDNKDSEREEEAEDYSEDEQESSVEAESYQDGPLAKDENQRNKREEDLEIDTQPDGVDDFDDTKSNMTQHDVNKREKRDFKIPEINLNSTFLNEKDILEIAKDKIVTEQNLVEKYPYYFKDFKAISKNSPLRYAENLKNMPRKSQGGTEFYDSRTQFECPEVDEEVDPVPEKLKKSGHPDDDENDSEEENANTKKGDSKVERPRLKGLGDKIDCFKAKYFGENPLDSPFFKEEIISNPEPITLPPKPIFGLIDKSHSLNVPSEEFNTLTLRKQSDADIFSLVDEVNKNRNSLFDSITKESEDLKSLIVPKNISVANSTTQNQQNNVYSDVLHNMKKFVNIPFSDYNKMNVTHNLQNSEKILAPNLTYESFQSKEEVTKATLLVRKKRSMPFVYEPYKIIRDVQIQDSKKTTTTSNISPLIKQLQTSKVIDAVVKSNSEDQPVKRNIPGRMYKDIGKKDREKSTSIENTDASFVDVSVDKRRGEPRYELRPVNHKSEYSPVAHKKAMSIEDYKARSKQSITQQENDNSNQDSSRNKRPSAHVVYDISRGLSKNDELQKPAASNTVKTSVKSTKNPEVEHKSDDAENDSSSEEDYDYEYEDDEEDEVPSVTTTTTTTTTTTPKPAFRRRIRSTTTTTEREEVITEEPPKLRLVTRFRNVPPPEKIQRTTEYPIKEKKFVDDDEPAKYREKKKKSTKSTLVTDTKRYGDDDESDMQKEEVDALIGVKHDMDEYMPLYEKEVEKNKKNKAAMSSEEEEEDSEEEDDDDDDEGDSDEEYDMDDSEESEEKEDDATPAPIATTTEAPKRTLARTTDAPPSTTETRVSKSKLRPVITRKKIEIHKESPVNKSAPHVTQFKQDIKEVEIIKEIPRIALNKQKINNTRKNIELLDLYKDDNLAKDVNKLGAVEVFKENLDLRTGPKHGGNYRRAPDLKEDKETSTVKNIRRRTKLPKDTVASQTENKKQLELDDDLPNRRMHGGNLKSANDYVRSRGRNEKLIELTPTEESDASHLHGGNLKSLQDKSKNRSRVKNEKLIELSEDSDEDDDSSMHGGNFKSHSSRNSGELHGGNYRSAKLLAVDNEKGETKSLADNANTGSKSAVSNAAGLLRSFAQAAPVLTTTPAYILDPSKRMYYYVDT